MSFLPMSFLRVILTVFVSAFLLIGAACSKQVASVVEADTEVAEGDRIAAVLSFAEWCPSCHLLDPMVEEVRASRDWDGVSFIRLDYTDRDKAAYFAAADAAGVGPAVRDWYAKKVITGQLLYVDVASQKVLAHAWKDLGEKGVAEGLAQALASTGPAR